MKQINTSPISGMQELLPKTQAEFNRFKHNIAQVFAEHGFQNIETPTIDRTEVLLAKAGGDTEKQIYKVVKTAETDSEADQALRFDHTVPLARYVVEHLNDVAFPFRVSQIGRNFRGERAQKGRFREFYQCDIDVVGRNALPVEYDAEVIATLIDALKLLPLPGKFRVRISNRKILNGLLKALNLESQAGEIFNIVDHAEKVPAKVTVESLENLRIGSENVVKITTFIAIWGTDSTEVLSKLQQLGIQDEDFKAGIEELKVVLQLVKLMQPDAEVVADMKIVRGLDYYTGTVFETFLIDYPEIGSICSGGRYENLAGYYTEQKLPGVGGSIGLTRLFYVLQNYGTIAEATEAPVEYCIVPLAGEGVVERVLTLARQLRALGHSVDIVWGEKKLGDKIKYASKVAKKLLVLGENEINANEFEVKDLNTGEKEILVLAHEK